MWVTYEKPKLINKPKPSKSLYPINTQAKKWYFNVVQQKRIN